MTPDVPIDPWHIISSDEIMLFHAGTPMIMMLLYPDGSCPFFLIIDFYNL